MGKIHMKTESAKTQEKTLETLEEAAMTVLNEGSFTLGQHVHFNRLPDRPDVQYLIKVCSKLQRLDLPAQTDAIGIQCQEIMQLMSESAEKWMKMIERFSAGGSRGIEEDEGGRSVSEMPPLPSGLRR